MPEAVITQRTLLRMEAEVSNPTEGILKHVFATDIVRTIMELVNPLEEDGFNIGWRYAISEVINPVELTGVVIGAFFDAIVKTINSAINTAETLNRVLGAVVGADIIKNINETMDSLTVAIIAIVMVRFRNEGPQQSVETVLGLPTLALVEVLQEALNMPETLTKSVIAVVAELKKTISETLNINLGIVVYRDRVEIIEEVIDSVGSILELAFIIGQVVGLFQISSAIRGWFTVNKELDR